MNTDLRIISLLPTATEIIYALGLGPHLVGVSHECTYPQAALNLPRVTQVGFDYATAPSAAIDQHVKTAARGQRTLYELNESLLRQLQPTHIVSQQLCDVCAITPTQIQAAIQHLPYPPAIVSLNPTSLSDICADILHLGELFKHQSAAQNLTNHLRGIMQRAYIQTRSLPRRRIFCAEWLDPLYAAGHWVPEMVSLAGGHDALSAVHGKSIELSWEHVAALDPDILILMPCGFPLQKTLRELPGLATMPLWRQLTAVRTNQVWVVEGPAYFSQSGPRVISGGIPLLAQIIHPDTFGLPSPTQALSLKHLK
jgi:iron complex transport system substrate-binding protein